MASRQQKFTQRIYQAAKNIGLGEPQARLAAAQAALETGYGRSVKGNNYFGIKAGSSWKGKKQNFKTWEEVNGRRTNIVDSFRAYDSPEQSLLDWAGLMERRYPDVLKAKTFDQAKGALRYGKSGGYATDSKYGSKLGFIERKFMPDETTQQPSFDLASLPQPSTRPTEPEPSSFLSSFSPVSSANAASMSNPFTPSAPTPDLGQQYASYQPARDTQSTASYVAQQQAKVNANPLSQLPDAPGSINSTPLPTLPSAPPSIPNAGASINSQPMPMLPQGAPPMNPQPALPQAAFDDRFNGLPQLPQSPPATAGTGLADAYGQMAQSLDAAGLPNIGATQAVAGAPPPASVLPPNIPPPALAIAQPKPVQQLPAVQAMPPANSFKQYAPPPPPPPPPPSAMDVWKGKSDFGVATGGQEIYTGENGNMFRYSPKYDHTTRINRDGSSIGGPMDGRVDKVSGGHFSLHSKLNDKQKGHIGGAIGGALGGGLAGPMGAIIASQIGRNIMTGKPPLSNPFNRNQFPPRPQVVGVAPNIFPNAPSPVSNSSGGGGGSYQDNVTNYGQGVADAVKNGTGGLF